MGAIDPVRALSSNAKNVEGREGNGMHFIQAGSGPQASSLLPQCSKARLPGELPTESARKEGSISH